MHELVRLNCDRRAWSVTLDILFAVLVQGKCRSSTTQSGACRDNSHKIIDVLELFALAPILLLAFQYKFGAFSMRR